MISLTNCAKESNFQASADDLTFTRDSQIWHSVVSKATATAALAQQANLLVDVGGALQQQIGEDHAGGQAVHAHTCGPTRTLRCERPHQVGNSWNGHGKPVSDNTTSYIGDRHTPEALTGIVL